VFGGGRILRDSLGIGEKNGQFVRNYLREEGLRIAAESLGGDSARRIHYYPSTGRVLQKLVDVEAQQELITVEYKQYNRVRQQPAEGDIELFS
jgi:chemotaxis protein CheD